MGNAGGGAQHDVFVVRALRRQVMPCTLKNENNWWGVWQNRAGACNRGLGWGRRYNSKTTLRDILLLLLETETRVYFGL